MFRQRHVGAAGAGAHMQRLVRLELLRARASPVSQGRKLASGDPECSALQVTFSGNRPQQQAFRR
eukprot:4083896-Prorocentrum_lima.AAC.1